MREIPINTRVQFMDEEKRSTCKRISELCEKDTEVYKRVKKCLDDTGVTFLEELPINALKFMLKLEESWENNTIEEVLIEEGIKRGFFQGASEKNLQ